MSPLASGAPAVPAGEPAPVLCANCGAPVPGHYCSNCGQRVEHAIHSLWHFLGEVTEDLTHADSRLWRTLTALLLKPGYLTCEFLAGRRMKYLPPLRLYLVMSVLFFLIAAFNDDHTIRLVNSEGDNIALESTSSLSPQERQDLRQRAEKVCANLRYGGPWQERVRTALRTGCHNAVEDDGRSLREAFMHNLPRAGFLMAPILAVVMKPLYRRQRRYYVEHLLFLLHNHAFAFLWFGLFVIVAAAIPNDAVVGPLAVLAGLYVIFYKFRAMRRVYGGAIAPTLGKLTVLSLAYLVTAGFVLIATGLYSVLVQ